MPLNRIAPVCRTAGLLLLGGGLACAQSSSVPAAAPAAREQQAGSIAEVAYAQGQLEITADNSSLNQILREIARKTGMKITGGVVDERVYGKYGPAAPAEILSILLGGTGSNMLLTETAPDVPAELILTPRMGGPTPPNPTPPPTETPPAARSISESIAEPAPRRGLMGRSIPSTGAGGPGSSDGFQSEQQTAQHLQQMQQMQRQQSSGSH
jgi:hypothetical protein